MYRTALPGEAESVFKEAALHPQAAAVGYGAPREGSEAKIQQLQQLQQQQQPQRGAAAAAPAAPYEAGGFGEGGGGGVIGA